MHPIIEALSPPIPREAEEYLHKAKDVRIVRLLLSPQEQKEDSSMTTRSSLPRAVKETQVVLPSTYTEEEDKLGSSSRWKRDHLKLLGVDFYAKTKLDLDRVLGDRESEWSSELRARVVKGAKQLGAVDMNDLCSGDIDIDEVGEDLAPKFVQTFKSLLTIMENQETKLRMKEAKERSQLSSQSVSSSTNTDAIRSFPQVAPSRTKSSVDISSQPRTPDQPTHPSNPKWSGSSAASQDEEATKMLLALLLSETMTILEADFRRVHWQKSGLRVELAQTKNDHMKFLLGVETITTINDGGLGIRYIQGRRPVKWQPGGIRPAKRQHAAKRDDPELRYRYAGQVFCEMLGQTCHKDFYEHSPADYQEAFVIHGSHSSVTIYYAKLPHTYLAEIARYGKRYLQRSATKQRVALRRTKKFHLQHTGERVELFQLLAKLLWYLISGESHVGYLHNYEGNPLHRIGQIVYDSITVDTGPIQPVSVESSMKEVDMSSESVGGTEEGDISLSEATDDDVMDDSDNDLNEEMDLDD